jgi:hypothetical protein
MLDSLRNLKTSMGMFSVNHAERNLCNIQFVGKQQHQPLP